MTRECCRKSLLLKYVLNRKHLHDLRRFLILILRSCGPYKLAKLLDTCFERYLFSNEVVALPKIDQVFQSSQELAPSTRRSPLPPIISATSLNDNLSPLMKPVDAPPASFRRPSSHLSAQTQILRSHSTSRDQSPASLNGDRFHVLIADDNLINRRILIAFMKRWNYSYDEAENGKMALEIYSETPTRFSLVLMGMAFSFHSSFALSFIPPFFLYVMAFCC